MNEPKTVGFYVGQIDDGRFAAASTSAPYFCFIEADEDAAIQKANAALDFFYGNKGTLTQRSLSPKNVVSFVPQRRIETLREYAVA